MKKQNIIDLAQPYINRVDAAVEKTDWKNADVYASWLAQTYYFVCHSTRLLCAAAARFRVDRDDLHYQLAGHVKEEKHHERLATGDLKAMGRSISEFPELPSTKNLYRTPYYLIDREHPIAFYGYVYALETLSLASGKAIMNAAESSFGENTVRFLKLHVNEDEGHIQTYADFINKLPEQEFAQVMEGVITTSYNYVQMLAEIRAGAQSGKRAA